MNKKKKILPRSIVVIALWMLLFPCAGLTSARKEGWDLVMNPWATVELAFYMCNVVCGIGLLFVQNWARKWSMGIFFILLGWVFWAIYYLSGPSLGHIIQWQSAQYELTPEIMKIIFVSVVVVYLIWPIIVILTLLHPSIKEKFLP